MLEATREACLALTKVHLGTVITMEAAYQD